jgi:acetyl esterase/lipase
MVLIVTGYADAGVPTPLGCAFKDMAWAISLAQLIAASGMAAVAYTTREPGTDAGEVLGHIARHAAALRIDTARVGLWAASGHAPLALALLMRRQPHTFRAAVLSNGFTLDATGSTVADAARTYRFVNPSAGRSVDDLPSDVPLFLVRSGRDEFPGLNDTLDRFVSDALARNLPVTLVNHATAGHAFELNDDSDTSRHVIGQMLAFLRVHLRA